MRGLHPKKGGAAKRPTSRTKNHGTCQKVTHQKSRQRSQCSHAPCVGTPTSRYVSSHNLICQQGEQEDALAQVLCAAYPTCATQDEMLVCDGCEKGYHIECLDCELDAIPDEGWYCVPCAVTQLHRSQVKDKTARRRSPKAIAGSKRANSMTPASKTPTPLPQKPAMQLPKAGVFTLIHEAVQEASGAKALRTAAEAEAKAFQVRKTCRCTPSQLGRVCAVLCCAVQCIRAVKLTGAAATARIRCWLRRPGSRQKSGTKPRQIEQNQKSQKSTEAA